MALKDFARTAPGISRNPLGIVALFIGFSEVMATLVLVRAYASLIPYERAALISFLVVFPVVVFSAFVWLVVKHHTKLYGPGDFRDDQTFRLLSVFAQQDPFLSKDAFDKLTACDKLKLLLTKIGVPQTIPKYLKFGGRGKQRWKDVGPFAFTDIRNSIVHPNRGSSSGSDDTVPRGILVAGISI